MRSAWIKWARATEHMKELAADSRRYEAGENFVYHRTDNAGDDSDPLLRIHWRLRMKQPYPERWAVQIGDVVTNLRDALDHAFWYAANLHSGVPKKPQQLQFLICPKRKEFTRQAKALEPLVSSDIWTVVEQVQPFHADSQVHIHPLEVLRWLSNAGKHREVHIVSNVAVDLGPTLLHAIPPVEVVEEWRLHGPAEEGAVLARLKVKRPASGALDLVPSFALTPVLQICDGVQPEYRSLSSIMEVIGDWVTKILDSFNTVLGLEAPDELELGERFDAEHADYVGTLLRFTDQNGKTTIRRLDK